MLIAMKGLITFVLLSLVSSIVAKYPDGECERGRLQNLPDYEDCSSYWKCKGTFPLKEVCKPGQLFDFDTKQCTDETKAHCATNVLTTTSRPPTASIPATTEVLSTTSASSYTTTHVPSTILAPSSITTAEPNTYATSLTTDDPESSAKSEEWTTPENEIFPPVCINETSDVKCPIQTNINENILLANPCSCTSFFQCAHGVPYKIDCPAGLHFNVEKKVCDYPNNAKCFIFA